MSRLAKIEAELKGIEGGRFQNLCNELLFVLGHGKVTKSGGQIGTDKTIKGTPDAFILLPNGKFVYIEYTVQEKNVCKKFYEDMEKCFDESKTGVAIKDIEKIIICFNTIMPQDELKSLMSKCESHGIFFEHFDISIIAQYLNIKYPHIAKDYFGIEFDTGQIMSYDVFIKPQRNVIFSTPLDNEFMFREDETKDMLEKLDNYDIVVVYGKPGVGKSRLSLEVMKNFIIKYPLYEMYCLSSNGGSINSDLQSYFANDGSYILLADDANRFAGIQRIIDLVQKPSIKLIFTVRDYAVIELMHNLQNKKYIDFKVNPLSDESIKKILMSDSIDIKNNLFLDRICTISNGNPRLAIMASKVAKETNDITALYDVSNIYKNYFSSIMDKVTKENEDLIKVLGIISYFQSLEKGSVTYNQIVQCFNIEDSQLWTMVRQLYELEVVDIYKNEVVKISDQVLATYFCYYSFIEESILEFSSLLTEFFFDNKKKMKDAIFPMLNTFDFTKIVSKIKPYIDKAWLENESTPDKFTDIINVFWFVKPLETLLVVKNEIELIPDNKQDIQFIFPENKNYGHISDLYIKILKNLTNFNDYFNMSIELLFLYLEKKPEVFLQVMEFIKGNVYYDRNSHYYDYRRQRDFIIFILRKSKSNKLYNDFLYTISFEFLKIHHNDVSEKLFNQREILFINFNILLTEGMKELRKLIFEALLEIVNSSNIIGFINEYIQSVSYEFDKDIAIYDFNYIEILFTNKLSSNDYSVCYSVNTYIDFLEYYNVKDDRLNILRKNFSNDIFVISRLLYDKYNKRELILEKKLSHIEIEAIKEQNIDDYLKNHNIDDYYKLYEYLKIILENTQRQDRYEYDTSIGYILKSLIMKDVNMYFNFIEQIIKQKNEMQIYYPMGKILSEAYPAEYSRLLKLIEQYEFAFKFDWILCFYEYLPENQVNESYIQKLKHTLSNLPTNTYVRLDILEKYYKYDTFIYFDILSALSKRLTETHYNFRQVFHIPNILEKINNDYDLLKELYLYSCTNEGSSIDYDGETIQQLLRANSNFITEYLDCLKGTNGKDYLSSHSGEISYKFLWEMGTYEEIMDNVIRYFSDEDERSMMRLNTNWHYINKFFGNERQKEKEYMKNVIAKKSHDRNIIQLIFIPISNIYFSESVEFIELLLKHTLDLEIFKIINFSRGGRVTSNSEGDTEECIKLWESFLPLTNSLNYISHREYICMMIEAHKRSLESERRSNYLDEH